MSKKHLLFGKYDATDYRTRFKPKKVTSMRYLVVEELTGDELTTEPASYNETLKISDAANADLIKLRLKVGLR